MPLGILLASLFCLTACAQEDYYSYKKGGPNGIGKWFMGREIAHVMGYQGIYWLERSEREQEERTSKLLENMAINEKDAIADIGAGSGYHVFKMAETARKGKVYAVDIQDEMLAVLNTKKEEGGYDHVTVVKGGEKSINLPKNVLDKVLLVDVYHEMSHPMEVLQSIYGSLKEDGKLYLIEYRSEDPNVPIKRLHKMSEAQAIKELKTAGFKLEENINNLPWQHCMVFVK